MTLKEGQQAPEFTLPDQDGSPVALTAFAGRKVLLYFYPKDDTPGCTTEACQLNDSLSNFEGLGVDVVGVSADDGESHRAFRQRYGLGFSLLSDTDHQVMEAYGAWGERTLRDGTVGVGVIRSSFLVGEEGQIERAWYGVTPDGHAAEVLVALHASD